jgi:hypothetical protein
MNAVPVRSLETAQRELQAHLMAVHARAMAQSAHALLAESRACPHCARLIAVRDSLSKGAEPAAGAIVAG